MYTWLGWYDASGLSSLGDMLTKAHPDWWKQPTNFRKLRLFTIACLRRYPLLHHAPQGMNALEVLSSVLRAEATLAEIQSLQRGFRLYHRVDFLLSCCLQQNPSGILIHRFLRELEYLAHPNAQDLQALQQDEIAAFYEQYARAEGELQLQHFREMFPPPFESPRSFGEIRVKIEYDPKSSRYVPRDPDPSYTPPTVLPEWRTSTVTGLLETILNDGAWELMPILSDALQDAGCDDREVINHLQAPNQPHHLNCWVLDWLQGY
jgi:hypothetical protein